jgi:hypothetical protein
MVGEWVRSMIDEGLNRDSDSESEMLMRTGTRTGWTELDPLAEEGEVDGGAEVEGESAKMAAASAKVCSAEFVLPLAESPGGVFSAENSSWSLDVRLAALSSKIGAGETERSGVCVGSLVSLSSGEKRVKLGTSGVESRLEAD